MTRQTISAQRNSSLTRLPADRRRLMALGACALLILLFFVPFFSWIRAVNTEALYSAMGLKASVIKKLAPNHSVLTFLSFVETSKQGILGFWSFLLLIVSAAGIVFCLLSFAAYLTRDRNREGKGTTTIIFTSSPNATQPEWRQNSPKFTTFTKVISTSLPVCR